MVLNSGRWRRRPESPEVLGGHPDEGESDDPEDQRELRGLRRKVDPDRHDRTDHGEEDRGSRAVMEEHRCGGPIDVGQPPGLPGGGGRPARAAPRATGPSRRRPRGRAAPTPPPRSRWRRSPRRSEPPRTVRPRPRSAKEDRQDGVEEHAPGPPPKGVAPTVRGCCQDLPRTTRRRATRRRRGPGRV